MLYDEAVQEVKAGRIRPVYLVHGSERYLRQEFVRLLSARLVPAAAADFNIHTFDPGSNQVLDALNIARTHPFLAEHRLVVVRDCPLLSAGRSGREAEEGRPVEGSEEGLLRYLAQPAPFSTVVFTQDEADSRRKLVKTLVGLGEVQCRAVAADDAVLWAERQARNLGKELAAAAAAELVARTGPNLQRLLSELEKLALYVGDRARIDAAAVAALVHDDAEVVVFRLMDAIGARRQGEALRLADAMLRRDEPALRLLFMITRHIRQLLQVLSLTRKGCRAREAAATLKVPPFIYNKLAQQARGFARAELIAGLERLLQADLQLKSGYEPRLCLQTLLVDLTRRARARTS